MLSWQFLLFLTITLTRQIPHILMEFFGKRTIKYSSGWGKTLLMYLFYIIIWILSLWQVSVHPPQINQLWLFSLIILVFGVGLRFLSLAKLGKHFASNVAVQKNHQLVRNGVYGIIRHPIYLAMILELLGMIGYSGAFVLLPLFLIMVLILIVQAKEEDQILLREFGQTAANYQATVQSFIPKIY